jgi:MFS family permease
VSSETTRAKVADWFGLNRATVAVLVVIGCLGLSEEIWKNFFGLHLRDLAREQTADFNQAVLLAVLYIGLNSAAVNLLEGFGYIIGGTVAHRLGPRFALAVSAAPMAIGFTIMLTSQSLWASVAGALLMTNWEPLSVPATFDVVGSEVPKNRRTIAFAVQSIQKRLPKLIGPIFGAIAFGAVGYWLNLTVAFLLVGLAVVLQLALTSRLRPKVIPQRVPFATILRTMPRELKTLLTAEIFIRWGDWFARDFAVIYVATQLHLRWGWDLIDADKMPGTLLSLTAATALATYVPIAKWVDRAPSPKPFIGTTFFLFSLFPILLVILPRAFDAMGLPVIAAFALTFLINGLRELGEPARKALISTGFPPEVRARAVGLYWGLRSFAFFPAPIVAALLWRQFGPDLTFLIGGSIGLLGTAWYATNKSQRTTNN